MQETNEHEHSADANEEYTDTSLENVAALQQELEEWKDLATRRAAEIENIRRRTTQEKEQLSQYAAEQVLNKLLPVIDDLHNAIDASQTSDLTALRDGLTMIFNKTVKVLQEIGVVVISGAEGDEFNVDKHEALMHISSPIAEGQIVQYVQRGYMLHDRVLRHAKVVTSAGPESDQAASVTETKE